MGRVLWLADVLRGGGCDVYEMPGWKERGASRLTVKGVVCHHTATSLRWLDGHVAALLREGRRDLAGPLAQLGLERDGTFVVIASGRSNHNGYGLWGNDSIGIEAYNDGEGEPWPGVQLDAFRRGVAAILAHEGLTENECKAHRETDPRRKPDPTGIDMPSFRRSVAGFMSKEDDHMTDEERMVLADLWVRALYARKQASGWPGKVSDADVQYWVNVIATRKGTFGGVAEVIAKA